MIRSNPQIFRPLLVVLAAISLGLSGCGSKDGLERDSRGANELYDTAKISMTSGNYDRAILMYKQLQTRYPFGRYTEQAQLELAFCYYKSREPDNAIATLDKFIRTYPAHPNIDYAFYLKGLVNYQVVDSFLQRMMPSRNRDRDQSGGRQAFNDFNELLRRFPDSRYAPDARQRMVYLKDNLSAYEIEVANYYLRRKAYVAAANRARYIIETYQNTKEAEAALEVLHQAYLGLEMTDLADDTLRVLALNYPDSTYLTGEKQRRSFLDILWPFD